MRGPTSERARTVARTAIAASLVLLVCCAAPRAPGLWARSVEHVVALDRTGLTEEADGSVTLTTDRGFELRVRRAYLVQASAQLVDCLGVGSDVWDDWLALRTLLGPAIAYAGHTESPEPSAVLAPRALDLVAGADRLSYGSASFAEQRYCRAHFLVAGLTDPSRIADAPSDVDLSGRSLYLEATVAPTGGHDARELVIASTLSDGAITDLPDALVGGLEGSHATLTVTRSLARAFDALALDDATLDDDAIARSVLGHLDHDALVTLEVSDRMEESP